MTYTLAKLKCFFCPALSHLFAFANDTISVYKSFHLHSLKAYLSLKATDPCNMSSVVPATRYRVVINTDAASITLELSLDNKHSMERNRNR